MTNVELSRQKRDEIFNEEILPRLRQSEGGKPAPATPEFAILGGQPGAGKTGVLTATAQDLRTKGATWSVNADDYAAFHPAYAKLQKQHGAEAADMVRGVTGEWIKQTIDAAQKNRVNVVFESTMRQPDLVKQTVENFRNKGYTTHAVMVAVSPELSWQGNHMRREKLAATGSPTRLATREAHDAAVSGSVQTVGALERDRAVDRMTLVTRSGDVIYSNQLVDKQWKNAPDAAQVLQNYRAQPMSAVEARTHDRNWQAVEQMAMARHARDKAPAAIAKTEIHDIRTARSTDAVTNRLQAVVAGKSVEQIRADRAPPGPGKDRA